MQAQQSQQITQRRHKKRGGGGRKRKGETRNRSKSIDKSLSDNNSSDYSITSLAVKCAGMSIVIGLFVFLYSLSVVILLFVNNWADKQLGYDFNGIAYVEWQPQNNVVII